MDRCDATMSDDGDQTCYSFTLQVVATPGVKKYLLHPSDQKCEIATPRRAFCLPKDATILVIHGGVVEVPRGVCKGHANLEKVILQQGVVCIGLEAFESCVQLRELVLPSTLTTIGESAFHQCWNLTNLNLGEGLSCLGANSFAKCVRLKTLACPSTLTQIEEKAFILCKSLSEVSLNEGLQEIGDHAFSMIPSLRRVTIPSTVRHIGFGAFFSCDFLHVVKMRAWMIAIEKQAFSYKNYLSDIDFPPNALLMENTTNGTYKFRRTFRNEDGELAPRFQVWTCPSQTGTLLIAPAQMDGLLENEATDILQGANLDQISERDKLNFARSLFVEQGALVSLKRLAAIAMLRTAPNQEGGDQQGRPDESLGGDESGGGADQMDLPGDEATRCKKRKANDL